MTMVLSWEESNYFSSSPIRRSHSQPEFIAHQTAHPKFPSKSKTGGGFNTIISPTNSGSSSAPSSPRTLHADFTVSSYSSTPARSSSLDASWEDQDDEDQIVFPSYDDVGYYGQVKDLEPPASLWAGDSYTVSPTSNSTLTNVSGPESPDLVEHAEDDTAVRIQPSRNHILRNRKAYSNSARLENASWRTWTKSKNKFKTVSPESLNWLKGCDATWLYGPLQTGSDRSLRMPPSSPSSSSHISKSNSFLNKKSILKKRSMSEIMLQRSLLGQAAVTVQAQQFREAGRRCDRLTIGRATSDFVTFSSSSRRMRRENLSLLPSVLPSGLASPSTGEEKHIHFNEQVEQYIALEIKGDEDEEPDSYAIHDSDDSDSDDGAIMMMRTDPKWKLPLMSSRKATPRASFSTGSKSIEMLPPTTLKDREDAPEPPETAVKHSNSFWNSGKLSPSPSQETLRDGLGDDDADMDWQPPSAFANRKDSMAVTQERLQDLHTSRLSSCLNGDPSGMRRTPSGMFMPYEEDEDDVVTEGLFGKVVDTVNTAKDIAYMIWNVGWRR
ncbi:protein phosphatase-like protein type 1 complex subunit Hex2/Reg1 [Leptodontidium sp. MPI-SDFR-AT-0119]|nr:protein phosphatase-like protein type 1 complex subunit Hex2/Reg1 [Leptodontidium sp. MPI-SDFR-AT-0119]